MVALPGDWVDIVHPETGGTHTCLREAFDEVFSKNGWVLTLDPQEDDEQREAGDSSSTASGQADDVDPEGKDQ